MTEDNKFELGVGPAKISASGSGVAGFGKAISDLVSPFSQGLGLLGDHVRIYRERSVANALEKAKEISEKRKVPIEPINPKNLIPWMENASLEDGEAEDLSEIWARLLLSGGKEFDVELAMFTDSLKRMSKTSFDLLKYVATQYGTELPQAVFAAVDDHHIKLKLIEALGKPPKKFKSDNSFEKWVSRQLGDQYFGYAIVAEVDYNADAANAPLYIDDIVLSQLELSLLTREGFLQHVHLEISAEHGVISATYYRLTNIGARLLVRCYPDEAAELPDLGADTTKQ